MLKFWVMRYFSVLLLLLGCLSCSVTKTELSERAHSFPAVSAPFDLHDVKAFSGNVALQKTASSSQDVYGSTYRINFGPQVVSVRASYREDAEQRIHPGDNPPAGNLPGYFDLRATSALAGTSLLGEGEMAYSVRNPFDKNMRPEMFRLGLKDRWRNFSYGADYRSVAMGFTPIGGTIAEQSRDETLIWGEQGFGALKLRGSVGESWERALDSADLRVTRTAATALQIHQARWGGSFSTSYGLVEQGSGQNEESAVLINKLTSSFRPSDFLLLEPNFSVREERNQSTGVKTQTPTSGLSFTYSPLQSAFRLTGATSFSRIFSLEGTNDARIHGTSAVVDWKLGKFLGREDTVSFSFNYNRHLDHVFRNNSHGGVSSMLQLKIAGF
jgi:hypothetical protein